MSFMVIDQLLVLLSMSVMEAEITSPAETVILSNVMELSGNISYHTP